MNVETSQKLQKGVKRKLNNFEFEPHVRAALNRICRRHKWSKKESASTAILAMDADEREQDLDNPAVINGAENGREK